MPPFLLQHNTLPVEKKEERNKRQDPCNDLRERLFQRMKKKLETQGRDDNHPDHEYHHRGLHPLILTLILNQSTEHLSHEKKDPFFSFLFSVTSFESFGT